MSGHSKWSTIKRKKGALDAKRGKIFSRIAKEIAVAAKLGGGDAEMNPRLRTVLLAAKANNMPKDNIERAIKKGTGEIEGAMYEEQRYECYGPAGVAIIVDTLSDNRNRTVADIRHIVTKHGGSMAESGAVTWNFDPKGIISVEKEGISEEDIFEKAIEAGAEDVDMSGEQYEVTTDPTELHSVVQALEGMGISATEARLTMVPKTTIEVDTKTLRTIISLVEMLEDYDDVQDVYSSVEITDEAMAEVMEA
ncbi:MAG: YebC/PmpR family DNA-binding transcriptional regulator [Candidatus Hydrogenedens sp.]|nr:YebC/PmpR family DNA-binding transcriptional regulator [Candidatus Hydrogenedens sp.]